MDIVYLDFSKALDKVLRTRLIQLCKAHEISGNVLRWVEDWLTNRKQHVVLNGKMSGIPQGSVLGPLMFLIFINNIDKLTEELTVLNKFADDTKGGKTIINEDDSKIL